MVFNSDEDVRAYCVDILGCQSNMFIGEHTADIIKKIPKAVIINMHQATYSISTSPNKTRIQLLNEVLSYHRSLDRTRALARGIIF